MKKFNLFLILAAAITVSFAGYVLFGGGLDNTSSRTGTILDKFGGKETNNNEQKAVDEKGAPLLLSSRQVISPTKSSNSGNVLYYDKNTGNLYELNLADKTERLVSGRPLNDLLGIIWSPLKRSALGLFYEENASTFKYLDTATDKETGLDSNIRSVAFSPDGNLVAAYYFFEGTPNLDDSNPTSGNIGKIVLSQPDGTSGKKIFNTRLKNLELSWPISNKIAVKNNSSEIFLLTENGEFKKLLGQKVSLRESWSPSGKKLLFSSLFADEQGLVRSMLWMKDIESEEEIALDIEGDASLCAWSKDDVNFICALQKSPSIDELYLVNSQNGSKKIVAEPNMLVWELFLSSLEEYVIFTNTADEKLYSIKIGD